MTPNFKFKEKFSKKKLTENLGLKITSLIVAIVLWLIVVNITDPVISQPYKNIPVKIINSEVITDNNKTLEVVDGSSMVANVIIKAPRSTIQELGNSTDAIIATADMSNLSKDGISVPIEFTTSKYADKVESIRPSSDVLKVNIENRRTIQLPLNATTSGEIESGYILGNVIPNQNQVRVSGPESVINRVASAFVDVQVTGFTGDISTQADIMLFDSNGDGIPTGNLDLNVSSVRVDVEILATKKVPIYYSTIGIPAEGYGVTGEVEINPELIVIAGEKDFIDQITEVKVPAEELNITGQSDNLMVVLDIRDYLPEGIRLADDSNGGKASITVFIEPYVEQEFGVFPKNLSIENVPEGYEAEFVEDKGINFVLVGLAQDLEKLQMDSLNARVDFDDYALLHDMSGFKSGEYDLFLVLDLPGGIQIKESVTISLRLNEVME